MLLTLENYFRIFQIILYCKKSESERIWKKLQGAKTIHQRWWKNPVKMAEIRAKKVNFWLISFPYLDRIRGKVYSPFRVPWICKRSDLWHHDRWWFLSSWCSWCGINCNCLGCPRCLPKYLEWNLRREGMMSCFLNWIYLVHTHSVSKPILGQKSNFYPQITENLMFE